MFTGNFTTSSTLTGWLTQLGIAALYALLFYITNLFFEISRIAWHFEPSSGLALAALLIGGKRYAWGVLLGAVPTHIISGDSLWEAVIIAAADTLQALCGAWLLTRGDKLDLRLQSMRAYLRLILLGGCASVTLGAMVVNISLLGSGFLTAGNFVRNLYSWWMGDMLGVILVAPLVMVWWRTEIDWRNTEQNIEAVMLIVLAIFIGQIIFLGWLHDSIGQVAKAYWMFIFITLVATRLGTRGTTIALTVVAVQAMSGAILGTGFFANDIAESRLLNYWFFAVILSVVGMTLATHFAERKRMESQLRNLSAHLQNVREKEMVRIAREIHDDLGSTLTALKMEIYMLKDGLSMIMDAKPHLEHMESISQLIKAAAGIAQRIITGLRPTILDDLGLLAALEWQAGQFQKFSGIECRVNCIGDKGDLDQPRSIALFRISQEALTNVARHSGASRVEIEYHHGDGEIVMSIIDNGLGIAENRAGASISYGILGMQERVHQLGGTVNFDTTPGGGFSVTVILPLTASQEDET
ncbi:MAG: MASE1 domain-containing protein [Nitrosomonadales bacterium]|nr:MASE1 domain-containing protein [Nitrosomonadales bacterium]